MQAISLISQHSSQGQNDKLNNLAIQDIKNAADFTNLANKNASVLNQFIMIDLKHDFVVSLGHGVKFTTNYYLSVE